MQNTASGSFANLNENVNYLDEPDYAMLIRTVDLSNKMSKQPIFIDEHAYNFLSNSNLFGGEIILSNIGSVGNVFMYEPMYERASLAPNSIMIRMLENNRYYYYWFLNPIVNETLKIIGSDSVQAKFNKTQLRQFCVAHPSESEQQKIADYLDEKTAQIDSIIDNTKQSIAEFKKYKQALITETVTKGLNPDVKMKDSGIEWIGEIPEHWGITKLKYLLNKEKDSLKVGPFGSSLKSGDYVEDGYWVYNQRTVLDSNFETNDTFISKEKYHELINFKIEEEDILITTRGSIGKVSRVPKEFNEGVLHPCIIKFKIDSNKVVYEVLEKVFNYSDFVSKQLKLLSNSTTIDVIYSYTLKNIAYPMIPIKEQQQIADYLDEKCAHIDNLIADKEKLIGEFETYKKALIFEYVTGKKEVD